MTIHKKSQENIDKAFNLYFQYKWNISAIEISKEAKCSTANIYREFKKAWLRFFK